MEKSKLEKIKGEVLDAVREHTFNEPLFDKKIDEWFYDSEDEYHVQEATKFRQVYNSLDTGDEVELSPNAINFMFLNMIARLTSDLSFDIKADYFKNMKKSDIVKRFQKTKKDVILTDKFDNEVTFSLLSKRTNILDIFPYAKDFSKREGKCHYHSMMLSQMFENREIYVVTGNIGSINDDAEFVHSWVEVKTSSGKVKVIDFNLNAIFYKDDYYRIRNAKPLSKISGEKLGELICNDFLGNGGYLEGIEYKILLLYFDDIIEILKGIPKEKLSKKFTSTQMGE